MQPFVVVDGPGPVLATAIHAGHVLRPELASLVALADAARLREEDPYTDRVASIVPAHVVVRRSRFEVDLNRPRASAVYARPEDAWGLDVWHAPLAADVIEQSLGVYDAFYALLARMIAAKVERHGKVAILDVHSYNHCRDGTPADAAGNPEINVGTGSVDHARWGHLVQRFMADLRGFDVRENVRFQGGEMSKWIHRAFPANAVCLAIELKKTFMDEATGVLDEAHLARVRDGIGATLPGLVEELAR